MKILLDSILKDLISLLYPVKLPVCKEKYFARNVNIYFTKWIFFKLFKEKNISIA